MGGTPVLISKLTPVPGISSRLALQSRSESSTWRFSSNGYQVVNIGDRHD